MTPQPGFARAPIGASLAFIALAGLGLAPVIAGAATPPYPIRPTGAPFPGSGLEPLTARQAGMAMAEYWLGDDAYTNPAGALGERGVSLTPLFQHTNRQDLAAIYRQFDEQSGSFDLASAQARGAWRGIGLAAYWAQPILRDENQAYIVGDITQAPSIRDVDFTMQEQRLGLAAATARPVGGGTLALGLAGEWYQRQDHYDYTVDTDGFPLDPSSVELKGHSWAGQFGARWDGWNDASGTSRLRVGAGLRYAGKLPLDATQTLGPLSGDTTIAIHVRTNEVADFGASARAIVSTGVSVSASLGRRGSQDYGDLGGVVGPGALWSAAVAYHDPRDPWGVWFGLGQDQMNGNPEPRASLLGLGFDVLWKESTLGIGATRKSLASDVEPDGPRWYAYSVLASLAVRF